MKSFFITGTDTGIGKTLTAAILLLAQKAYYWKPIQSGVAAELTDCQQIQQLTHLPATHFFPSCYSLQASLSPDQAAKLENVEINHATCQLPVTDKPLIVEGAGGVFVPLNERFCMLDLIQHLHLPVIIVTRGTLGTINHTLLTIAALRQRNINIHGVIFSGTLHSANQAAIEHWGKVRTLLHIPFLDNITAFTLKKFVDCKQTDILQALI